MKKANLLFIAIGISIFFLGAWGIYNFESPFLPLLLFLGSFLLTLPTGIWQKTRLEEFFATKSQPHTPIPHEPLFLARLFVALSYIARHRGILGLCESKIDKNYNNVIYHLGKNLVIDGYDHDYVKEFLENALRLMHERINAKIHFLKQSGLCLTFVGLSGGLAGAAAYALRCLNGSAPTGGLACLILIATMFLMLGVLFFLLLPGRIRSNGRKELCIQRQVARGLQSLQSGDSYVAILLPQYAFLNMEEIAMIAEDPLPAELRDEKHIDDYENALRNLRIELHDYKLL